MKAHIGIVGAGFSGAVLARELAETEKFKVTVFDERSHLAGNCFTQRDEETGVMVHKYSPHIFHTEREDIWNYVNQWGRFEPYLHKVKAHTKKGVYSFPLNLLTLNQFFGKKLSPDEAKEFVLSLGDRSIREALNFEEEALKTVGRELYNNFFYGCAKKLWGMEPKELPASLFRNIPIRFDYEDHYYTQRYQGIPVSGYTEIIKRILDHPGIEVRLGQKLESERKRDFDHLFWAGPLDGYFKYNLGRLNYQTMEFERSITNGDLQGCAVIHYCEEEAPFVRVSEHKYFAPWEEHEKTISFREYSKPCGEKDIPFYPIGRNVDFDLLAQYSKLAEKEDKVTFMGRLGTYRYLSMQEVITEALELSHHCVESEIASWPKFSVPHLSQGKP